MTRLNWLKLIFLRYYRKMGLRVLLYALLSFVATLISPFANSFPGDHAGSGFDFSSVTPVLTILATSMLAVSTFSLNIMVTAHRAAADTATPRMHRILLEDTTTQSVLAVFIGAFVYSLGSLVLYRLGFYPETAALTVMAVTTLVVVAVVVSLLRWISHLTTLGSLGDSLSTARSRARDVLRAYAHTPAYGAVPMTTDMVLPVSATPFRAPETGYLQLIDMKMLQDCLPDQATLYLTICPGAHVLSGEIIGHIAGAAGQSPGEKLAGALTFGSTRTHEQDARFGLSILAEIACKALSPGINDNGTAIEATLELKSLLWDYARHCADQQPPSAPQVVAHFPGPAALVQTAFEPIMRDGAGAADVALCLRESLAALTKTQNTELSEAAFDLAEKILSDAKDAGLTGRDLERLSAVGLTAS